MRFILLCIGAIVAASAANEQIAQSLQHDVETQVHNPGERIWVGHGVGYLTVILHEAELQATGELVEGGIQPEILTSDDGYTWYGFPQMPPIDYMENAIVATSKDGRIWIGLKEELTLTPEDLEKASPADAEVEYPSEVESQLAEQAKEAEALLLSGFLGGVIPEQESIQSSGLWWGYPGGTLKNPTLKSSNQDQGSESIQSSGLWWGYPGGTLKNPTLKSSASGAASGPGQSQESQAVQPSSIWWGYPGGVLKNPTLKSTQNESQSVQSSSLWWGYPAGTLKNPTLKSSASGAASVQTNLRSGQSQEQESIQSSGLWWGYPGGTLKNPNLKASSGSEGSESIQSSGLWWGYPGGTLKNPAKPLSLEVGNREVESGSVESMVKAFAQADFPEDMQHLEKAAALSDEPETEVEKKLKSLLEKELGYPAGTLENPNAPRAAVPVTPSEDEAEKEARLWWGYPAGTLKNPNKKAAVQTESEDLGERYEELKRHMEQMGYAHSDETKSDDSKNLTQELEAAEKIHMEELQRLGESATAPAVPTNKIPKPTVILPTEVPETATTESVNEMNKRFQELKAKFDQLLKGKN